MFTRFQRKEVIIKSHKLLPFEIKFPSNLSFKIEKKDENLDDNLELTELEKLFKNQLKLKQQHFGQTLISYNKIDRYLFKRIRLLNEINSGVGIIIIADEQTKLILNLLIDFFQLKSVGIIYIHNLNDSYKKDEKNLKNNLTKFLDIIYLIDITYLVDDEFNFLLNELNERKANSITFIHTRQPYPDKQNRQRLKKLNKIINEKSIEISTSLNLYNSFDPYITIFEFNLAQDEYFLHYLNRIASDKEIKKSIAKRLTFHLVSFFNSMDEYPIIRYRKSNLPNDDEINICKIMEKIFSETMEHAYNKRKKSRKHLTTSTLLLLDRSFDLITPISHSVTYEAFVTQELGLQYKTEDEEIDKRLRYLSIHVIPENLIKLSNESKKMKIKLQLNKREHSLNTHTMNMQEIIKKINTGYVPLIDLESKMITMKSGVSVHKGGGDKKQQKDFLKLIYEFMKENFKTITDTDLLRLAIIYLITNINPNLTKLEKILKKSSSLKDADIKLIKYYVNIAKSVKANETGEEQLLLGKIIEQFANDQLQINQYPFVRNTKLTGNKRKLIIFIIGGISYKELKFSGYHEKYDLEVTLVSDCLLTPTSFLQLFNKI